MKVAALCIFILSFAVLLESRPVEKTSKNILEWLAKYDFYRGKIDGLSEDELVKTIAEPLKLMKEAYNISPVDGVITDDVLHIISTARCGETDGIGKRRQKRWAQLGDSLWGTHGHKMPVTIGFRNYWKNGRGTISKSEQEDIVKDCAIMWGKVSGLEFKLLSRGQTGNINIRFTRMDGPYNSLGYAISPTPWTTTGSDVKLDADEPWITRKSTGKRGVEMLWAMCHEIGHSLGLSHSSVRLAMMYPTGGQQPGDGKLAPDDIEGVQSLYGRSNGRTLVGGSRKSDREEERRRVEKREREQREKRRKEQEERERLAKEKREREEKERRRKEQEERERKAREKRERERRRKEQEERERREKEKREKEEKRREQKRLEREERKREEQERQREKEAEERKRQEEREEKEREEKRRRDNETRNQRRRYESRNDRPQDITNDSDDDSDDGSDDSASDASRDTSSKDSREREEERRREREERDRQRRKDKRERQLQRKRERQREIEERDRQREKEDRERARQRKREEEEALERHRANQEHERRRKEREEERHRLRSEREKKDRERRERERAERILNEREQVNKGGPRTESEERKSPIYLRLPSDLVKQIEASRGRTHNGARYVLARS